MDGYCSFTKTKNIIKITTHPFPVCFEKSTGNIFIWMFKINEKERERDQHRMNKHQALKKIMQLVFKKIYSNLFQRQSTTTTKNLLSVFVRYQWQIGNSN